MAMLTDELIQAWDNREPAVVLTTVDADGKPNSIYASCASRFGDDAVVIANNYFSKTMDNLQSGGSGAVLFITKDRKAYQLKGPLEYHTQGEIFDDMKKWNPEKHPGHGAAVLRVKEAYSGANKLI